MKWGGIAVLAVSAWFAVYSLQADLSPSSNLTQPRASSATVISSASVNAVKATAGTLHFIVVTTSVASATIKLFDLAGASCTGTPATNPKAVITMPSTVGNPFTLEFQQPFASGICVLTSGATNVTILFD